MIRTRHALLAVLLLILPLPALHAGDKSGKRPITLEDLWKVKRLGKPAISPDGQWVAVDVTSFDMDDNSSSTQIWLCSSDGKTQKQLTAAKVSSSGPIWSPDGKSIAFVSKRGDSPQIYVISPDGGEAKQLTNLPLAPSGLKWGADGKTLYCVVWTWPDTPDDESYRKKEKAKKDDKVQAYVIDDALFRVWDHWIADGKRPVVFAVDAASGKHKNLFANTKRTLPASGGSAADYDVSPDGKEICFTSESAKELGRDFNSDLYVMPLDKPGEPKNITADNPAADFAPVYSLSGGGTIFFLRQTTKYFYADRSRIMVHRRKMGKNLEVTKSLDRSCRDLQFMQNGSILFEAEDKGYHRLFIVDPALFDRGSGDAQILPVTSGYSDLLPSVSADGKRVVFLRSNFGMPPSIYTFGTNELREPRCIEHFNDTLRAQWDLGELKNVIYKGADNDDVQMWIVYPRNFDAKKKWPLLMMIHGGPHNAITTDFHYRWNAHLFASKGYVVAIPNFHGSSGFGQKFTDSITGDMATKPFIDVMKATDYYGEGALYRQEPHDRCGGQLRRLHDGVAQWPHRPLQGDGLSRRRLQLAQHDGVRFCARA